MNTYSNHEAKQIRELTALSKDKKMNRKLMIRSRLEDFQSCKELGITIGELNANRMAKS